MASVTSFCPKCGSQMTIRQPAADKMVECPGCFASIQPSSSLGKDNSVPDDRKVFFNSATVIGTQPAEQVNKGGQPQNPLNVWLLTAAGLLVAAIGVAVGVWILKGDSQQKDLKKFDGTNLSQLPKPELPKVLIDEDFRDGYEKKLVIPEKWEQSDAFVIVKDDEAGIYCLQVSKPAGVHYVKVPLSSSLAGNFSVEGAYRVNANGSNFSITLFNQNKNAILPVVFFWNGSVSIADDLRNAPTGYKTPGSGHFALKRDGKKLRVFLNNDLAFDKNLDEISEYDMVRISLIGGTWGLNNRADRLYGLKILALP